MPSPVIESPDTVQMNIPARGMKLSGIATAPVLTLLSL
jgi:hypothetical protein